MKAIMTLEKNEAVVEIELFEQEAPGTVKNFVELINKGFYNGLNFHRVIPGFVAQGGCPNGTGMGGPGYKIKCEAERNTHVHQVGALSMAHAGKDTGGSQFFICYDSFPHLDKVHTIFGQVTSGMEHVLNIKQGDKILKIEV